jgi:hypothetical protein
MPALTFDIYNGGYTNLLNKEIELQDLLKEVFYDRSYDYYRPYESIISSLLDFHKDDGGSPENSGFEIVDCSYDVTTNIGKVRMAYKVSFSFGCADIHRTDEFTETSKFWIDMDHKKLTLFITDHIRRDTVDEF